MQPSGDESIGTPGRTAPVGALAALAALALLIPATAYADDEAPTQVLLIPLTGELEGDLAGAAVRLTAVIGEALGGTGSEVVTAKARGSDISGIAGCTRESPDCFRDVAETIGVQAVVFGTVETDSEGKTVVTLTHVGIDTDLRTREIDLEATSTDAAAEELRPRVDDFIANRPEETDEPIVTPPVVEPEPKPPGFDFGRVKTYSWATAGGGAAAMALGAIFYALASSKQSKVDDAPTDTGEDIEHLMDLESSGKRYTTFGNVFMIGGTIAAVVGGVLVVMQARSRPKERTTAIGIVPATDGDGMTITWGGTF